MASKEKIPPNLPRILLVDDEAAIRRFLKTVLNAEEFSLHFADNGHAALGSRCCGQA